MSISSVSQSHWHTTANALTKSYTDTVSFSPAATSAGSGSPTSGTQSKASTGSPGSGTNPFQQLATDLQATLVQFQSGAGATGATGTDTSGESPSLQQIQTDLQAALDQLRSGSGTGGEDASHTGAQQVGAQQVGAQQTGAVHHRHHHAEQQDASAQRSASQDPAASLKADFARLRQDVSQALRSYDSANALPSAATARATA